MANLEKHKKNLLEWSEEEEVLVPTHSRSSNVLGGHIKNRKPAARKPRLILPRRQEPRPDPALMREPAPLKLDEKHSQLSSWEHLRKLERLPQLRAPFLYKRVPSSPKTLSRNRVNRTVRRRNARPLRAGK